MRISRPLYVVHGHPRKHVHQLHDVHASLRQRMAQLAAAGVLGLVASSALALDMPIRGNDLSPGERLITVVHGTGGGPQTGAKDLRVLRRVADNNWQVLKPGKTDDTVNANYLIYGRPIHATAPGKVVGCWRNAPENVPHGNHPDVDKGKITLGGNHLWIRHDDGNTLLYAHAIPGSIPESLCPHNAKLLTGKALGGPTPAEPEAIVTNGATVTAGQVLGKIGNSGNSSEPHLHVHMIDKNGDSVPMAFERGQTTSFASNKASLGGPWTPLKGAALPMAKILIWPAHPIGNWTYNGIDGPAFQRVFDHFVDSGMMADTITCKNNGASYGTTWVPAKGAWVAHHGMTASDFVVKNAGFVAQGFKLTSIYTCGTRKAAVWRKA